MRVLCFELKSREFGNWKAIGSFQKLPISDVFSLLERLVMRKHRLTVELQLKRTSCQLSVPKR